MAKRIVMFCMLVALCGTASAQGFLEMGLGGGFGKTEGVDRRPLGSFGANIGLDLDNGVDLGIFISGFQTSHENDSRLVDAFDDVEFCFRGLYGGFYGDKRFLQKSFFYCNAGVKLGFGGTNYSNNTVEKEVYDLDDNVVSISFEKADNCFIMALEPYVYANFTLGENFMLSAGAEYRNLLFTNLHYGQRMHIAGGNDLNGVSFMIKAGFIFEL